MKPMTSRERVLAALSHQQPDRVPIDLSGSAVSGITARTYDRVKKLLKLELGPTRIFDRMNQLAVVDDEVLDLLGIDTRGIMAGMPAERLETVIEGVDEFTNEWGLRHRITPEHDTYFVANAPLSGEISKHDILNYPWPNPDDPGYTDGLRERILELRARDERAIVMSLPASSVQYSQLLRGFSEWFVDIAVAPDLICLLIDQIQEIQMGIHDNILAAVGDIVDVVFFFDDMAMQDRLIVRPEVYTNLFEPRLSRYVEFLRRKTTAKIVYHTDGAIAPILGSIAAMGIDAVNPLQVSAKGMGDVAALKREFGGRLAFWGGVDSQHTLPSGTPEDVRRETVSRIQDLNQNGGYILGAVHNIQVDVPAENALALFEAALGKRFGVEQAYQEVVSPLSYTAGNGQQTPTSASQEPDQIAPLPSPVYREETAASRNAILDDIYEAILDGDKLETVEAVKAALEDDIAATIILDEGCIPALDEVGRLFEIGDMFVPEMLISALAMKAATDLLKPYLLNSGEEQSAAGKVVIGTVHGDLHDIGKNLVSIMLEGAGFEIVDLGIDVTPQQFVAATQTHQPEIVAMSALLTTTTRSMVKTIAALKAAGLRDQVKVMVGGAPITQELAAKIGADGFAADAGSAARKAKELLGLGMLI